MVEKMLSKRYSTQNCIENCIANYCDAIDIDCSPMFLYSWDLGYDKSRKTVGERIHYHYSCSMDLNNYIQLSELYLNFSFEPITKNINVIEQKCEDGAIFIISMDSFNCPWNLAYHKFHYPHYFLLCSNFNGKKDIFAAIDSFSTLEPISIDISLMSYVKECFILKRKTNEINEFLKRENIRREFLRFISLNLEKGIFNLFENFNNDLLQIESIDKLSPHVKDISDAMIVRRLTYISNSRYNTALLMSYLDFDELWITKLKSLYKQWESLKNYFIKILISNKINMINQANEMICVIAQAEIEAIQEIQKFNKSALN